MYCRDGEDVLFQVAIGESPLFPAVTSSYYCFISAVDMPHILSITIVYILRDAVFIYVLFVVCVKKNSFHFIYIIYLH